MKVSFQHNQYYIEVFDDIAFTNRPDSETQYDKVYESELDDDCMPSSQHAVIVYGEEKQIASAIVLASGGATSVTEDAVLIDGNNLVLRCSDALVSLTIPKLEQRWLIQADPITCFSIHQYKDSYISHGELTVCRIDRQGNKMWEFGGMDILLRLDGKNCFTMNSNSISLQDFEGNKYEIDYNNGKSVSGYFFDLKKKTLQESDFIDDDFADDKEIQKRRAEIKAYENMVNGSLAIVNSRLGMKEIPDEGFEGFDNLNLLQDHDAGISRTLRAINAATLLQVFLVTYHSSVPTARLANSGTDQYLLGHLKMKKTFPQTYIHKETVKEKMLNVFLKRDIDLSNSKLFSKRFQLLSEDKKILTDLLQFKNLDTLANFAEMEIEIKGTDCFFRHSRKAVSIEEAENFAELAKVVVGIFG